MATKMLQQLDFAQSTLGEDLLAEDICDLFDGNAFGSLTIDGSAETWGWVSI